MEEIVNLITNNGIGVICVAYLIYFQSTTMKEMVASLKLINERLYLIENTLNNKKGKGSESNV